MPGLRMYVIIAIAMLQLMVSPTMSQPKCDFLKIARDYIAKEFPVIDFSQRHPVTSESDSFLEVRYDLPPDRLGLVPVIVIDKWTCEIVHAHVWQ